VKKTGDKIDRWGFDHKMQPQAGWLWQWGLANGGKFISDDLKKVSYNDPKIVEALDWGVKNYQAQGGYQAYQAAASTWQGDEQFARGLVAMTMYENFLLGIIARTVPDLNFVVMAPRKRNGGPNDWLSYTGGNAWTITSGVKEADAGWEFIKFMCEETTWAIGAQAVKDFQAKNNRPYVPSLTGDKIADQLQIERFYTPIAAKFDDAVKLWPRILDQSVQVEQPRRQAGVRRRAEPEGRARPGQPEGADRHRLVPAMTGDE
jgi:ABC-type glycerol-3-phosphate transport system substrate-binding protein